MKKTSRIISLIVLLATTLSMFSTAYAAKPIENEPQASRYFAYTEVTCIAKGGGKVTVEVDINATHTMTSVGPTKIEIWERQSSGNYTKVKTYSGGMLSYNDAFAYATKTYQGTAGKKYYARATLYAEDSNGSQTMNQASSTITAL